MKKLLIIPFLFFVLVVLAFGWFYQNSKPVSGDQNFRNFIIEKGSSASVIGDKLASEGFIRSSLAFKLYTQFSGRSGKIQAGEFRLSPSFSLSQVIETFLKGPVELWVTIPEGLRREEVAARFTNNLNKDQVFVKEFLVASKDLEGQLFPDTYLFPKEASASAVVARMKNIFTAKTQSLKPTQDQIILASLIERETKTVAERPVVSGIILKRLRAGWPLQIDAAVQYAVGTSANWWPILTKDNIAINSPYNTYKFAGLPPTPICAPGLSSIEAAVNPVESDYWYYIHDDSGQIHYAKTLEEHNQNVAKYL